MLSLIHLKLQYLNSYLSLIKKSPLLQTCFIFTILRFRSLFIDLIKGIEIFLDCITLEYKSIV